MNTFLKTTKIIFLGVVFGLGLGYVYAQTATPPSANTLINIDVGPELQIKTGNLVVNSAGTFSGFFVSGGNGVLNSTPQSITLNGGTNIITDPATGVPGVLNISNMLDVRDFANVNDTKGTTLYVNGLQLLPPGGSVPLCAAAGGLVGSC